MDRIRALFAPPKASADEYEPLADDDSGTLEGSTYEEGTPFSWVEYAIFALVGVAMLWAWNMFLAAAPYFQTRFQSDPWIYANSQSAILTTSTVVNLAAMLILTNIQSSANYPLRINMALFINAAVFAMLTISTSSFLDASPKLYLAFLLLMVALTAWAAGLMQNGAFSFAASFGRPEYTQAIMAGQGVAGILPPLTQMLSFLAFSDPSLGIPPPDQPSNQAASPQNEGGATAAFIYFLTAVLISALTLAAFIPLVRRHTRLLERRAAADAALSQSSTTLDDDDNSNSPLADHTSPPSTPRRYVPLTTLFRKLSWLAASVAMCFIVTMFFPVFTAKILSVHDPSQAGKLFSPGAFIPLGFFFWNLGDLAGRVSTMLPAFGWLRSRPRVLFAVSLARWGFLPLYLLCNLHGQGAVVGGDLFYLAVVQFPFGLTNGWLGSSAMMAAGEWVAEGERGLWVCVLWEGWRWGVC
ncbi:nucleoside transporter-domain-containing protein [Parachaetomium inaequale]|uniref:Nucleoside transporter-domain-containing protein n=1 Tax=Parachaetomium inaequale TaxID=2588326 RepID=A0AAN6P6H0_9PEZI|nr:nucleoside transporter-domain-containing protein [Parachaetomium inaequale]